MAIPLPRLFEDFKAHSSYPKLNKDQRAFCELFFEGKNLFLSGSAGVGKSFLINALYEFLYSRSYPIAKTATTGVAALSIGGSTVYSFLGIGLGDEDEKSLATKVRKNKKAVQRIRAIKTLVIDEISMASAELFDKIDYVLRTIRGSSEPCGGVQLIGSGCWLQLPPVFKRGFEDQKGAFCFNSKAWKAAKIELYELKKLMRQDENSEFAKILQKIRFGDPFDASAFDSCFGREFPNGVEPIRLFCINKDIDKFNTDKLNAIKSPSKVYYANDTGDEKYVEFFNKNCPAPKTLELKVGAQVMLLKNIDTDSGLVNGSLGKVINFCTDGVTVRFFNGSTNVIQNDKWELKEQVPKEGGGFRYKIIACRNQIPLKLAYASSIHKSQGLTLDCAEIDLSRAWEAGMHYVALSRVKSIESLRLIGFNPNDIKTNKECVDYYRSGLK